MVENILFFRADGNNKLGLGHLVRCTSLAHMLRNDFEITFFSKDIPDSLSKDLLDYSFRLRKIYNEEQFVGFLSSRCIVVLDGYHFDSAYQRRIKAIGARLVCIDDLVDKEYYADLIINHAPGVSAEDYNAQDYTIFALGPDYALLRPAFLKQARIDRLMNKIETVFICFGGSDSKHITEKVLQAVVMFTQFKRIIVVTGPEFKFTINFKATLANDNRIDHYHAINDVVMMHKFLESELAIVPASGILFEALAAKCIVISGYYVENQKLIYDGFNRLNAIIGAGDFSDISHDINCALSDFKQKRIIDGFSDRRLLKMFKSLIS